jgi:uncharacterized RDD family membrane protein YckC
VDELSRRTDYGGGPVPPGAFAPRETPQRLGPDTVYADWWKRVVAALIDGLIVLAATAGTFALIGIGFDSFGGAEIVVGALLAVLVFGGLSIFYAPVLMARTNGQTLGKMAVGIRVARAGGQRVDFWWAAMREVLVKSLAVGAVASFTFGLAYLVDWLWPLYDKQNRALHDFVVDSRVIDA